MRLPKDIPAKLLMPLLYLNLAGLVVSAVWLGLRLQWQVIWLGVMMLMFSPVIIPILLVPAGIFSHFMSAHAAAGRLRQERAMFLCSIGYIIAFFTLWCVGIFEYVMHNIRAAPAAGLLWAATASLGPLLIWSSRDRGNVFIVTMVETAQVAMLVLCALWGFSGGGGSFWQAFAVFALLMAALALPRVIYDEKNAKKADETPH